VLSDPAPASVPANCTFAPSGKKQAAIVAVLIPQGVDSFAAARVTFSYLSLTKATKQ
jgi:hypothetical protein